MNLFQKVGSALSGGKPASGTTPSTPASQPATEADFAPVLQVSALDVLSDRPRAKAAPPAAEPPKPAPTPVPTQAEIDEIMSYIPPELRKEGAAATSPSNFRAEPAPAAEPLVSSLSAFLADGARHLDTPSPAPSPAPAPARAPAPVTTRTPEPAYVPAPVRAPEPAVLGPLPANPNMAAATEIQGFVGACLVDGDSGLMLASEGGGQIDMEAAAALDSEVVKAEREAMALMGLDDHIEDILVTLGKQLHFLRPLQGNPDLFFFVALDKKSANLGMARMQINRLESTLAS